jgi:DNA sulfur modification protein DndB
MGEWVYYMTSMTFADVDAWIKRTDEIYISKKLADWIQRQLDNKHAARIAKYLCDHDERLFNSIVVGLYGAQPSWSELSIADPRDELTDEQEDNLTRSMGLLRLSGSEKLFAIDGQHRVAGIKQAIKTKKKLRQDEISVLLVAHSTTKKGKARTRRLFTTLNKTAKKVTLADIVALDEDNGLAVTARRLVDEFDLFQEGGFIAFAGTAAIPETDQDSITSIITLYEIAKALYPKKEAGLPTKTSILRALPKQTQLDSIYEQNTEYWTLLAQNVAEYQDVFAKTHHPGEYRKEDYNHLLFRPIGQMAFAGAVRALMDSGRTLQDAVGELLKTELRIDSGRWHYVLWDPAHKVMLKERAVAESLLLMQAGASPRTPEIGARINDLFTRLDADHPLPGGKSRLDLFAPAHGGKASPAPASVPAPSASDTRAGTAKPAKTVKKTTTKKK